MAYEFSNSNESPKYTVVDILGRFFFSPDIQDRNLRTNHPTGLFHGHHLILTNLFTKSELSAFWQKLVVQGYSQAVSLTNRAWLPATIEDALRLGSAKHSTNHAAYDLFIENKFKLCVSEALLFKYYSVFNRPKFKKYKVMINFDSEFI